MLKKINLDNATTPFPETFTAEKILDIYRLWWQAELSILSASLPHHRIYIQ